MHTVLAAFNAVADETRLRILRILLRAGTPLCVAELVDIVRKPQYAVSRALSQLVEAGLVTEERRGKLRFNAPRAGDTTGHLFPLVASVDGTTEPFAVDDDRLRWRLDLRQGNECTVTYTAGYAPDDYKTRRNRMADDEKRKVLFICVHNTARSQMAEAYLRHFAGDLFEVESAGLTPGTLNPYVVRVMQEEGFDISRNVPQSVFDLYRAGKTYTTVVTVCSREAEEGCPVFPGPVRRLNWPFPDPGQFTGSDEEILAQTREVRDRIRETVKRFAERYRKEHQR